MRKRRVSWWAKERASFQKKAGRKKRKEGAFRKKVHKFLFVLSLFSRIETFFYQNLRYFETKSLLLRLIKHNFPFIPPHCGVHIAQSRGTFPDHPAQTLFDLLNRRDFVLSLHLSEHPQKRYPSTWGGICTTTTQTFFDLYEKKEAQGTGFCSIRKGVHAFFGQRGFGYSYSFLVLPPMQRILVRMERFLYCISKLWRERYSSLRWATTKLPTNRRKTRFVGSSIIS